MKGKHCFIITTVYIASGFPREETDTDQCHLMVLLLVVLAGCLCPLGDAAVGLHCC